MLHFDATGQNLEDLDLIAKFLSLTREEVCADLLQLCLRFLVEAVNSDETREALQNIDGLLRDVGLPPLEEERAKFRRVYWTLFAGLVAEGRAGQSAKIIVNTEARMFESELKLRETVRAKVAKLSEDRYEELLARLREEAK